MGNEWIEFVKDYANKHNISYKDAISKASKEYKKGHGMKHYSGNETDEEVDQMGGSIVKVNTISLDVPLFIRLLEWAREDVHDDPPLHIATENILRLGRIAKMRDYKKIIRM